MDRNAYLVLLKIQTSCSTLQECINLFVVIKISVAFERAVKQDKNKLTQLASSDRCYEVFEAASHKYKLYPTISREVVSSFEAANNITLPEEYV